MWFHPPINHGFWGVFRFWRNGQARPRHWNHMKPPKIQEHHLSGACTSFSKSFHPILLDLEMEVLIRKFVTIFIGKMMMNPGNTCCFRIIFRYRTRHFHFATSPLPRLHPCRPRHRVNWLILWGHSKDQREAPSLFQQRPWTTCRWFARIIPLLRPSS